MIRPIALLCFLLVSACSSTAQIATETSEPSYPPEFSEAPPLYTEALGSFSRPVTTTSERAQQYFDQGFQMMYAFAKQDASRSFREARLADPDCAACYWAEAWSWGSYLNGPMGTEDAPRAWWASRQALARRASASPRERALIDAISVRYVQDFDPGKRAVQDTLYADAMARVAAQFPDDLDIATLYGEALFLLEDRRGTRDVNDPDVMRLHAVLEGVLARDIRHAGACHLYIHATESTQEPGRAADCAEHLGNAIPGASHINHMPSHTWNQIGRWGDAVRGNIQAWHSDQKAEIQQGFAIYPSHNLHMLLFAASMDGQGAVAVQAGKDYTKLTGNSMYHVLTLLRFGRFDEIREVAERPRGNVPAGLWDFSQGYARLRGGEVDYARLYLGRVKAAADTAGGRFRGHSARHLLGLTGAILEGELERKGGHVDAAIRHFERSVAVYDSLEYDEPEPLPFSPRHWLGNAQLEAGQFEQAEATFRQDLDAHPHNGWALFGLIRAIEGQGKPVPPSVTSDFEQSWARADTWIRGPIF